MNLTWIASTDNSGVRSYDIYRGGALVGTITGTVFLTPATVFEDSGLSTQTAYSYYVVARDGTRIAITAGLGTRAFLGSIRSNHTQAIPLGLPLFSTP